MRLYEYEAKQIFQKYGINVPQQIAVIKNIEEINNLSIKFPAMVKAMILVGGRGKAGGIKKVNNISEAKNVTDKIFNLKIHGYKIERILIEEAIETLSEIYLAITTDPATFDIVLIASAKGGVDIEEIARVEPENIWKKAITNNSLDLDDSYSIEAVEFLIKQNPELIKVNNKTALFCFSTSRSKNL
jgi:succinyl-CoA synthetase beta subunit